MAGKGEDEFARLMNLRGVWTHKNKDVIRCPNCFSVVSQIKRTDEGDDREVKATIPDYQLIVQDKVSWVECKYGIEAFHFADKNAGIRAGQYVFMQDWLSRGVKCWLYLSIGPGRAPRDRKAYLVPWMTWMEIEEIARSMDMKSIPFRETRFKVSKEMNIEKLFTGYEMEWVGKWTLPDGHEFTKQFPEVLNMKPWREYAGSKLVTVG